MADLILTFHGGLCCGVKTIHGFGFGSKAPETIQPALEKIQIDNRDQSARPATPPDTRFFHLDAPKETTVERLKRYLEYMKKRRPCNIVEVCLAEYATSGDRSYMQSYCQSVWFPILLDLGFKEVNKHLNSNSGNTVHVFHLNVDENYPGKAEREPDDEDEEDEEYDDEDDYCSCGCGMRLS